MPDVTGLELIAHELRERFPGSVADTEHHRGHATVVAEPGMVLDVLRWLRDDPEQRYTFLASLHAADYLPAEPRLGVHYELLNMERPERVCVKALLPDPGDGLAEIDSCVELFPTAEFQEREAFDMFGIAFRGHPDMRRILMPEDYEGYPLRRDFPIGGEPVLFTHNEYETPRWYEVGPA
jgi:NADH-quinone oxidoreductase subunit C